MTETLDYTFDWQATHEKDGYRDASFASWCLPVLLAPTGLTERIDELSDATEKFTKVTIAMTVNGIPVSARAFFEGLDHNYDWAVGRKAQAILDDINVDELQEAVTAAQKAAVKVLREKLEAAGVQLPEEDSW